jgi:hypothetical protein
MTDLQKYTTVNSSSQIIVSMNSISHVIEHNNTGQTDDDGNSLNTCWIHFHSGKSVHINTSFSEVSDDLEDFYIRR